MIPAGAVLMSSRSGAGEILCSPQRRAAVAYLVSIGGPLERPPAGMRTIPSRLRLVFDDVVTEEQGGPSRDDIERLVRFAKRIDFNKGCVLVHCQAGIGRSSAAALVTLSTVLGPGHEHEAAEYVLRENPRAIPNRRILELGDDILGSGSCLLKAWAAIGGPAASHRTIG